MILTTYEGVKSVSEIIKNKKNLRRFFLYVFVLFITFNSLSVYAQEDTLPPATLDPTATFQAENQKSDKLTGDPGLDAGNISTTQIVGGLDAVLQAVLPEAYSNYEALQNDPDINPQVKTGLVTLIDSNMTALLYNPPTENVYEHMYAQWVPGANKTSDTSVYAQDGYAYLTSVGIDTLWQSTSVIAYILFVVALIVAGFMIMFRHKIGGQMAVTVLNTIPSVVFGLILVTMSFAIVGLVMNLGAMLVNVAASILGLSNPASGILVDGPFSIFKAAILGLDWFKGVGISGVAGLIMSIVGGLMLSAGIAGAAGVAIVGVLGLLIALLVVGIVATASIKVWFTLLKAYIGIIIDTGLAPLIIAIGVIPGQSKMSGDWFKRIVRNVLTFPLAFFFVNLGLYIFNSPVTFGFPTGLAGGNLATAPATASGIVAGIAKAAITVYMFYVAAEVPKMLDDFIPLAGGKGSAEAFKGAAKGAFGKLPIFGSAFA
ncbi:hypothetical protein KC622_01570 [Candidatus Dojkabacteria bacterium]|uniref:Uncharacterized protein n=1 Tax=Candidatus Dojkabacteria bacterium TaxID=2099670 RepID=A0A955HXS8_9BACT|nr:hypothetical protein [Candidatus Dojkabacteria bacterium]MCB9790819.1 hypothetical protein [Candidatus Nomurabacteria bacterium]